MKLGNKTMIRTTKYIYLALVPLLGSFFFLVGCGTGDIDNSLLASSSGEEAYEPANLPPANMPPLNFPRRDDLALVVCKGTLMHKAGPNSGQFDLSDYLYEDSGRHKYIAGYIRTEETLSSSEFVTNSINGDYDSLKESCAKVIKKRFINLKKRSQEPFKSMNIDDFEVSQEDPGISLQAFIHGKNYELIVENARKVD